MSQKAAVSQPPPLGDALDELRKQFPTRAIFRALRDGDTREKRTGDYYAPTAQVFTDTELEAGCVKTVFADTPERLRELLAQQSDAPPGRG